MIVERKSVASRLVHAGRWVTYLTVAFVFNVPILVTVMTSFKTPAQVNSNPPVWLFWPTPRTSESDLPMSAPVRFCCGSSNRRIS